jgi:hypothetical protein
MDRTPELASRFIVARLPGWKRTVASSVLRTCDSPDELDSRDRT